MALPKQYIFSASSTSAICLQQNGVASTALTFNGVLTDWPSVTPRAIINGGFQRTITITSASGSLAAVNFAITGLDINGAPVSETLGGPGAGLTVTSANQYATILSITPDATANAVLVGTGSTGVSRPFMVNVHAQPSNIGVIASVTGTINYSLQATNSKLNEGQTAVWVDNVQMSSVTATDTANYIVPESFIRFIVNSSSGGTLIGTIVQAGIAG